MLKVLELFAGIGACSKALERLGIEHKIVDAVEIDKYAIESFNAIHNTEFKPQDITKWDKDLDIDLIMHGSPCQDFSVAGKGAGGDEGTGTRSSLMYETIRIVEKIKPKYVIWENVKNVLSKKHKHNFNNYINRLSELGYNSYYQVLNSKDYGIPQNRERVFTISIRKDIDKKYDFPKVEENKNKTDRMYGLYNQVTRWGVYNEDGLAPTITASMGMGGGHVPMIEDRNFKFPEKEPLKLRLKDMLEDEVDEKYYLSDVQIDRIKTTSYVSGGYNQRVRQLDGICNTLAARDWKDPKCVQIGNLQGGKWDKINESCRRVYDEKGISPTIHTCQGGNTEPKVITHNIVQTVKVRKHPVDTEKLKEILRDSKLKIELTNNEIAKKLEISKTQVEHWFRTDDCFSIPNPDIWLDLKRILNIETDEFDESIMLFEEKEGVYEKANRIYGECGIAPTITQQQEKIIERTPLKFLNRNQKNINGDYAFCVDSSNTGGIKEIEDNNLRIRKLTPLECWRLQGFNDEDFYKAKERLNGIFYKGKDKSNSQLYKQAGNSITVNVLEKIFLNLF